MSWFGGSPEAKETATLLREAARLKAASRFQSKEDVRQFIIDLLVEVCDESDLCLSAIVAEPLGNIVWQLLVDEPFLYDPTGDGDTATLREGMALRERLRRVVRVLSREEHYLAVWRHAIKSSLIGIVETLPVNALIDPEPDGSVPYAPALCPSTPLYELVDDLPLVLSKIIMTLCATDLQEAGLFQSFDLSISRRLCLASGIPWMERLSTKRKALLPVDRPQIPLGELTTMYTDETVFEGFFQIPVPIPIPPEVRFEHTHIVGGTGHGKTQLLQYLINDDLMRALDDKLSLVIFDPDGTLIKTISHTDFFGEHLFRDRAIFIDPTDIQHPVGLNLFDTSHLGQMDTRTRETVQNNTIELFEYFFDALLGSELTGRQTTLFRYLGLLLMRIPGANIHTLRELMEDPSPYKRYFGKLEGSARIFFETRFNDPSLRETKKQILTRLWGVLASQSLDRIFSATRNSINFDHALAEGKIIFIHTSKEYLGEEGSHIFARLMVALIGQSLIRRAALAPEARVPTYIYIDEAEGVVDQTLVRLLAQVRKYRGAITFAHQHLDQLSAANRAGVLANTSIKLCGGISAKDAAVLAPEMRVPASFLLAQKRVGGESQFALYARNITPAAMRFSVPLGYVESIDRLDADEYAALLESSRDQTAIAPLDLTEESEELEEAADPVVEMVMPEPVIVETVPADLQTEASPQYDAPVHHKAGGVGARHREIQMQMKELGEAAGFRVSLEESILEASGRVDVILRRPDMTVLVEVSVTTTREHEFLNVKKCLEYGGDHIWVVAVSERHRAGLERYIGGRLREGERANVLFLTPLQMEEAMLGLMPRGAQRESVVKGYRVRSRSIQKSSLSTQRALRSMFTV